MNNYLGSIFPVASVSNKLKTSLSYSTSSSVRPGLSTFFLAGPLVGGAFLLAILIQIITIKNFINILKIISLLNTCYIKYQ